jgi:FtsZ-binding cell division protein ZapB
MASVKDLEERVTALEMGATFDATKSAVEKVQMECLAQLREIRESLEQEDGGAGASSKELTSLQTENSLLKAKMQKQEYRIQHLVGVVEELLAQRDNARKKE